MEIKVVERVLGANDAVAAELRKLFAQHNVRVVNFIGSPGAGKTTLLEKTLGLLKGRCRAAVIEGDIATTLDAERLASHEIPLVQINTGGACHLDAPSIKRAVEQLDLGSLDLIIIENVGNLVCPAEFDLGEDKKILISSTAEGDDKVQKYPLMFHTANAVVLNKMDLAPLVDFNLDNYQQSLTNLNPNAPLFKVSCKTGENLELWAEWLVSLI